MRVSRNILVPLFAFFSFFLIAPSAFAEKPIVERRYLRFVDEETRPRLETSILRFQNKDGVTVDLIGAVHIADPSYYDALNKQFKGYDAVLYEMVKPKAIANVGDRARKSNSWIGTIQKLMKSQLDLSYQLDKVDYTAKNFVHADMDAETFAQKQEERGESMWTMMLNSMMREMSKSPDEQAASADSIANLLAALQAPDSERRLKLVLAKQFESMDESLDALGGSDSVIIGERNKVALKVMTEQIEAGKKNLAVFYGAGHLKGMEELMTTLMGFKAVGEPQWLIAWDMTDADTAVEEAKHSPPPLPSTQPAGVHD